ncbi:MAG: ABC transporter ATP-binding protein [Pontixanthobacter sp.]
MTLAARNLTVGARLNNVSAAFVPGQITAICGPNGAGKSTLLAALAGLLAPDSGAVMLDGGALSAMPHRRRAQRIGYLPQDGEVAWDVAVRSLVALGRMPHGDNAAAPVDAALDALDLTSLADRPVSKLSGGEKARALLARVLAGQPDWILADEPLAALDIGHQQTLLGHLRREAERGTGVVIVLHDLALAMNHADSVVVLNEGKLAAIGAPEEALSEAIVAKVWGVAAKWIGEVGARAFVNEKRLVS